MDDPYWDKPPPLESKIVAEREGGVSGAFENTAFAVILRPFKDGARDLAFLFGSSVVEELVSSTICLLADICDELGREVLDSSSLDANVSWLSRAVDLFRDLSLREKVLVIDHDLPRGCELVETMVAV